MLRRIAAGVGANIFDKVVISVSQLAMVPLLAGAWGLHLYGLWVLLATVPQFLAMGDLGFASAAGIKMTMAEARGDRNAVLRTFQSAWAGILGISIGLGVLAMVTAAFMPIGWFGNDPGLVESDLRITLALLLLYGIAALQGSIFVAGLRCAGKFAFGTLCHTCMVVIETSLLIAAVLAGASPVTAAGCSLLARLIGLSGQFILLRRHVPWLTIGFRHARMAELKSLVRPAGAIMMLPMAQATLLQGTAIAVGAALGQAAVPAFTAARTLSRIGQQMCWMLNSALLPEASAAISRKDRSSLAIMVFVTLLTSAALVVPFALLFVAVGQEAIGFWTHGIVSSPKSLLAAMAGSIVLGGFWFPISNLILSANRQGSYAPIFFALSVLSVAATYLISKSLGVAGAGVSMLLLDLIMFALVAGLAPRVLVPWRDALAMAPQAASTFRQIIDRRKGQRA